MSGVVLIVALLGTVFWGAQNYFGASVSRSVSPARAVLSMQALGLVMLTPVALIAPGHLGIRSWEFGTSAALTGVFGWVLMFAAAAVGQIAVTQKLCAGTAAIFPFAAGLAVGAIPSALAATGFGVLIVALFVLTMRKAEEHARPVNYRPERATLLSFLAGLGLGGALVSLGQTRPSDGIYPFVVYRLVVTLILIVYALVQRKPLLPPRSAVRSLVASALCSSVGDVCVLWALQHGSYLLVPAITSLFPAVTAVLAWRFAKERLLPSQVGAMCLGFVGLILMRVG